MMKNVILSLVTDFYNGLPLRIVVAKVTEAFGSTPDQVVDAVGQLVAEESVSLTFESIDINPHVKRFPSLPVQDQLERLQREQVSTICVYPTEPAIRAAVDVHLYDDSPFTKRLVLAEPSLTPVYFDLRVLETYHSDPRYTYHFDDYNGFISVSDKYFESDEMLKRDRILLQTFGIGYDSNQVRVVVVPLRYLSDLSPEHQRVWEARVRTDECKMVYEYYQSGILAEFAECMSTYGAIVEEQKILNELASAIGNPLLFRQTHSSRPRGFSPLLRPTRKAFQEFILLLDKMLSDNINKAFFGAEVPLEEERKGEDGKTEKTQRGTLKLLDEWLRKTVRFPSEESYTSILDPLREVRKLRQQPAHALQEDEYDMEYVGRQDELMERVHHALGGLCIVLSRHPKVILASYKLPDWLEHNKVKTY